MTNAQRAVLVMWVICLILFIAGRGKEKQERTDSNTEALRRIEASLSRIEKAVGTEGR